MDEPTLEVTISYGEDENGRARALQLTEEILSLPDIEPQVASWRLIPCEGATFDFVVNGELLFSTAALGRIEEKGEIRAILMGRLAADAHSVE